MCIKIFKTNLGRRVQREGELKCWRIESTQILALTLGFLLSATLSVLYVCVHVCVHMCALHYGG